MASTAEKAQNDPKPLNYRVKINVSGKVFSAKLHSLQRYPETLLGSDMLHLFYDSYRGDYFFDRDPDLFHFILNFYRAGKIHISTLDCPGAFQDEMDFFGIPQSAIDQCCANGLSKAARGDWSCNCRHNVRENSGNIQRSNCNTLISNMKEHDGLQVNRERSRKNTHETCRRDVNRNECAENSNESNNKTQMLSRYNKQSFAKGESYRDNFPRNVLKYFRSSTLERKSAKSSESDMRKVLEEEFLFLEGEKKIDQTLLKQRNNRSKNEFIPRVKNNVVRRGKRDFVSHRSTFGRKEQELSLASATSSGNGKCTSAKTDERSITDSQHGKIQCCNDERKTIAHVDQNGGIRVGVCFEGSIAKTTQCDTAIQYKNINRNIISQSNRGTNRTSSFNNGHFKNDNLDLACQVTKKQPCVSQPKSSVLTTLKVIPCFTNVRESLQYIYGLLILLSAFCNTVETIDCKDGSKCGDLYPTEFFSVETFFVVVFTIDYFLRFIISRDKLAFVRKVLNVVDLLAILPYYLELFLTFLVGASDVMITFRVLRVLRLMKLTRSSPRLQALLLTLKNSLNDLLILYFILVLGIVLFGSIIYYAERDGSNAKNFTSIPDSLWFTCVTMVTTGYGDVVPVTVFGKIFAALCGFCGVLMMSLPIPIMQERKAHT